MAKEKDFNEFAWAVSEAIVEAAKTDETVDDGEMARLEMQLEFQEKDYKNGDLSGFGFVKDRFFPDWFYELFGVYYVLEETKRDGAILDYLMNECGMTVLRANDTLNKLSRHFDIPNEFYFFIKNGRFASFDPITAKGYTAQKLCETTCLSPVGAYNYLIYIREHPEEALNDLQKGLPRK